MRINKNEIYIIFCLLFLILGINNICLANSTNEKIESSILNIEKNNWIENFKAINFKYDDSFFKQIKDESNNLKNKRNTEFFSKLNSEESVSKNITDNNNPLLQLKHKKSKSKNITDLDLNKSDLSKIINLIPVLQIYYNNNEISKFIPYMVFALNYNMNYSELNYYIKHFVRDEIPADIALQRLYNLVNNSL